MAVSVKFVDSITDQPLAGYDDLELTPYMVSFVQNFSHERGISFETALQFVISESIMSYAKS